MLVLVFTFIILCIHYLIDNLIQLLGTSRKFFEVIGKGYQKITLHK